MFLYSRFYSVKCRDIKPEHSAVMCILAWSQWNFDFWGMYSTRPVFSPLCQHFHFLICAINLKSYCRWPLSSPDTGFRWDVRLWTAYKIIPNTISRLILLDVYYIFVQHPLNEAIKVFLLFTGNGGILKSWISKPMKALNLFEEQHIRDDFSSLISGRATTK